MHDMNSTFYKRKDHTFVSTETTVSSMAARITGTAIAKGVSTARHLSVVSGTKSTRESMEGNNKD